MIWLFWTATAIAAFGIALASAHLNHQIKGGNLPQPPSPIMVAAKHNPVAKAVRTPAFRPKVVKSKKTYSRKRPNDTIANELNRRQLGE